MCLARVGRRCFPALGPTRGRMKHPCARPSSAAQSVSTSTTSRCIQNMPPHASARRRLAGSGRCGRTCRSRAAGARWRRRPRRMPSSRPSGSTTSNRWGWLHLWCGEGQPDGCCSAGSRGSAGSLAPVTIACSGVGYIRLHTARCACVRLCMHTAPFRFTVLPRSDTRQMHKEHVHSPLNQITRLRCGSRRGSTSASTSLVMLMDSLL